MSKKGPIRRSKLRKEDLGLKLIDDRHPFLRKVCHGDPARSFWFRGRPLPLCSRCIMIYPFSIIGFIVSLILLMLVDIRPYMIFISVLIFLTPLVIDGYTQYQGWRESNNTLRAFTGLLAGTGIGLGLAYMVASIIQV